MALSSAVNTDVFHIVSVTLLVILQVTSIALNGFCLYVIRASKSLLRKASTIFIINLLVLQLFQSMVVLPFYIARQASTSSSTWQKTICNGFRFSYMVTFYGTCLGVLLTSIDRFLAVYWITQYKRIVTKKRVSVMTILSWIYVLVLCCIPFFNSMKSDKQTITLSCLTEGTSCDYNQPKAWTITMLCVNTALPYILSLLCYKYVINKVKLIELRAHPRNSQCFDVTLDDKKTITLKNKDLMKHKKITTLALLLCVAYALLWAPSVIYYTLKHICPGCFGDAYKHSCWSAYIEFLIKFIAFLNAIVTPVIYCFYQKEFRRSVPASLRRSQDIDVEHKKLLSSK